MIICFSGWKGSGKDSCANYLIEKYNAVRVALADPLKDSVAEEFGIDRASLDDPKRKESPILTMSVEPKDAYSRMIAEFMFKEFRSRKGLQPSKYGYYGEVFLGIFPPDEFGITTDILYQTPRSLAILKGSTNRSVNPKYWVDKAFDTMGQKLRENPDRIIVVTDVRYKSELTEFKERFGEEVVFIRVNRFKESPSQDPSERDLDDQEFDFYVDNTGSLEQAFGQMEEILARLAS